MTLELVHVLPPSPRAPGIEAIFARKTAQTNFVTIEFIVPKHIFKWIVDEKQRCPPPCQIKIRIKSSCRFPAYTLIPENVDVPGLSGLWAQKYRMIPKVQEWTGISLRENHGIIWPRIVERATSQPTCRASSNVAAMCRYCVSGEWGKCETSNSAALGRYFFSYLSFPAR